MASYSGVVINNNTLNAEHSQHKTNDDEKYDSSNFVKPIFIKDVHGATKPPRSLWLTNIEICKAMGQQIPPECIKGIQRVREMWKVYLNNEEDRLSMLVTGQSSWQEDSSVLAKSL